MVRARIDEAIEVREAVETDVPGIVKVFASIYGDDYPHPHFYDEWWLKRSVFSDDILMLVAIDSSSDRVVGTASVVLDVGAHTDLVGEFGRLAVHADDRGRGVGNGLMRARLDYVRDRVHIGIVENRCVHTYSQRISVAHGFACVGFLPMKHYFHRRESVALYCRHFEHALSMRRNHPRLIPEVAPVATAAMENCGLVFDGIIDEASPPYPQDQRFSFEELGTRALPALLRIERGRVRYRDLFGPMRLQYGTFRLAASHAAYLVARDDTGTVRGAIGFIRDPHAKGVRIFELISVGDHVVRPLITELLRRCGGAWGIEYVEADVSGFAPRMQRTLVELGFVAAAYLPAMVFHSVERLDVVKMVLLRVPLDLGELQLVPESERVADIVASSLRRRHVLPQIAAAVGRIEAFRGLSEEQQTRVAGACSVLRCAPGDALWSAGDPADAAWILLEGEVDVYCGIPPCSIIGRVGSGEVVGEVALLTGEPHSATVRATQPVVAAVLGAAQLTELERRRPDIAVTFYKNIACGLGRKLRAADRGRAAQEREGS